jgi:hypothetical protein
MPEDVAQPEFRLHFEGEATQGHQVPAAALVKVVQALQRSIQLLAFAYEGQGEGQGPKQRLRASHEIERKYAVIFSLPEEGGYALPYRIGGTAEELFTGDDVKIVAQKFQTTLRAVQAGDPLAFRRAVTDANIRRKLINELKAMQPPPRTGLIVSIEDARRQKILDGRTVVSENLISLLAEPAARTVLPRLVTGRLDALEFQTRTLRLRLPTERVVTGTYSDDFEPILRENPREWIQVRGEVTLNEDGTIHALDNITEILEVDDSPIIVAALSFDNRIISAVHPIKFDVTFDPLGGDYTATGDFHMMVSAETRVELEAAVDDALAFLWNEYVVSDDPLSEDARLLRDQLVEVFGRADAA